MGRQFTVRTDHKNLLYLANSTVPKLVRWRIILSEYNFIVEHIPGKDNVVADGLTRVNRVTYEGFSSLKKTMYRDDTLTRIFRLEGKDGEVEEFLEDEDSQFGTEEIDPGPIEKYGIFKKFHNSCVGHFGVTRTVEAMLKAGHTWELIQSNVSDWIRECGVCQKIKYQRDPNWQDEVEHHLYSSDPLVSLSMDTLGPLPEDEDGNKYVILIMDNFSKFVGLYPTKSTTAKECIRALLQ
jgi:Integrase zinc binding domain